MANPDDTWETANLHVEWRGRKSSIATPFKTGHSRLIDLVPAARAVAHEAIAVGIALAGEEGREVSCHAGCGACCRQLVAISMVEAQSVADVVAGMPAERQAVIRGRFADAVLRLEESGLLSPGDERGQRSFLACDRGSREATLRDLGERYFALKIACPFLEDESCGIHPDRPLVCREHHVTTPAENCTRLYELNVDRLEPAARIGEALARTTDELTGQGGWMIPLILSLEWAENNPTAIADDYDGTTLFQTFLNQVIEQPASS